MFLFYRLEDMIVQQEKKLGKKWGSSTKQSLATHSRLFSKVSNSQECQCVPKANLEEQDYRNKTGHGTQTPVVVSGKARFNSSWNLSSSCLWSCDRDALHLLNKGGEGEEDNKIFPCLYFCFLWKGYKEVIAMFLVKTKLSNSFFFYKITFHRL